MKLPTFCKRLAAVLGLIAGAVAPTAAAEPPIVIKLSHGRRASRPRC